MKSLKDILREAEKIRGDRWRVIGRIGGGGFGQVYRAYDGVNKEEVAIKVEPRKSSDREILRMEVTVLRRYQQMSHAPKFYGCGSATNFNYMVMQLLSRNLTDIRRESPNQTLSISTTFRLGRQAIEALADLHAIGFLHRDVKPSNFSLGLGSQNKRTLFLYDFGLARQYVDGKGIIRNARKRTTFRGTLRYAPIAVHQGKEMGRHDEFWSLLYMLVEMSAGSLPWRRLKQRTDVEQWKMRTGLEVLCEDLPEEMVAFGRHLSQLDYYEKPNYPLLDRLLCTALERKRVCNGDPFDWEENFATVRREGREPRMAKTEAADTRAVADDHVTVSEPADKMPNH